MAETSYGTSPKLGQTADEQPYAPISWLAVAASLSALIFTVALILLAGSSFLKKQPLIMPTLLFLPVITFILAFAAYCQVNNSEGTRTGRLFGFNLVTLSGGIALLGGAGYAAYLGAMEFAVRKDAENVFLEWTENLKNLTPNDPYDKNLAIAVHRTLEPSAQQRVSASDVAMIRNAFSEFSTQFSQCDMVRICMRNPGKVEFKPQGLVNWIREQQKVKCTLNADLHSPEGVHTISLDMMADIAPNGQRLWGLQNKPSYVNMGTRQLTPFGRYVEELENSGGLTGQRFLEPLGRNFAMQIPDPDDLEAFRRRMYLEYIAPRNSSTKEYALIPPRLRTVMGGGIAAIDPPAIGYEKTLFNDIFKPLLPATGLSPDERARQEGEFRSKFAQAWSNNRIARPGTVMKQTKDVFPILTFDDRAIYVSVPAELMMPGAETPQNTTRARFILECTDPKIYAELKSLQSQANSASATPGGNMQIPQTVIPWRVVRIESDMKPGPAPMPAPQRGGMGEDGPG